MACEPAVRVRFTLGLAVSFAIKICTLELSCLASASVTLFLSRRAVFISLTIIVTRAAFCRDTLLFVVQVVPGLVAVTCFYTTAALTVCGYIGDVSARLGTDNVVFCVLVALFKNFSSATLELFTAFVNFRTPSLHNYPFVSTSFGIGSDHVTQAVLTLATISFTLLIIGILVYVAVLERPSWILDDVTLLCGVWFVHVVEIAHLSIDGVPVLRVTGWHTGLTLNDRPFVSKGTCFLRDVITARVKIIGYLVVKCTAKTTSFVFQSGSNGKVNIVPGPLNCKARLSVKKHVLLAYELYLHCVVCIAVSFVPIN